MSNRGSYTQLNTFDNGVQVRPAAENQAKRTERPARLLVHKRAHISRRDIILISIILLVASIAIVVTLVVGLPRIQQKKLQYYNTTPPVSSSPLVSFRQAVVITDGQPCAPIGKDILTIGGSAVDSAVAMLFCGGVVNPQSMGLGGGFFMTIYNRETNSSFVIDGRETAPENSTEDMFQGNASLSTVGGLAIAVPGELRGYWMAHQTYGKLNWSSVVAPSIRLCREGFSVSSYLAERLQEMKKDILAEPSMRELFYNNATGDVYREGEILKRPVLARTLEKIAVSGADVLYSGELATQLVNDIQEFGGIISLDDMKNYEAKIRSPIAMKISERATMYSVPPPGSGAVIASILNILKGYNLTKESTGSTYDILLMYHRILESFKFSFAKRTQLGDEDFVNITQLIYNMTSPRYGEYMRRVISDTETYPQDVYGAHTFGAEDQGTAQVSVVAPNGDAVSATATLNTQFGCMRRSRSTGIILNSNMDDFSSPNITNYFGLPPSSANFIAPGKRPMSSMSPIIFVDSHGNVSMVLGGAGGSRIITATSLVASGVMWLNHDIKQAIDAPRIHHQLHPNFVQYERGFPQVYLDGLNQIYGHEFMLDDQRSVMLGIVRNQTSGDLTANVDHRKGGGVDGF